MGSPSQSLLRGRCPLFSIPIENPPKIDTIFSVPLCPRGQINSVSSVAKGFLQMKEKVFQWIKDWQKLVLTLVMLFGVWPFYMVINYYLEAQKATGQDLTMAVDQAIPFMPLWQYVYMSIYTFVLLPAVYIKHNETFRRAVYAFLMVQLLSFGVFLSYPTRISRPVEKVAAKKDFTSWGIHLNYQIDKPYNCFPSLHVANSYVAALTVFHVDPRMGILALIWGTLISFSTLAVKHHFFWDIVGGFAIAFIGYLVFLLPQKKPEVSQDDLVRSRGYLLIPLYPFLAIVAGAFVLYQMGISSTL